VRLSSTTGSSSVFFSWAMAGDAADRARRAIRNRMSKTPRNDGHLRWGQKPRSITNLRRLLLLLRLGRHGDVELEIMVDGNPFDDRDGAKRQVLPRPGRSLIGNPERDLRVVMSRFDHEFLGADAFGIFRQ